MTTAKKLKDLEVSSQSMEDLQKIEDSKTNTKEFNRLYQKNE